MTPDDTYLHAALAYVTGTSPLGVPVAVVPLGMDKRPLIPKWGDGNAPDTEERVREAWGLFPNAGIGVLLKDTSLVVLDVEGPGHNFDEAEVLANIKDAFGRLPATLTSSTPGGGRHLFFTDPAGAAARNLGRQLIHPVTGEPIPGVDVKGAEGGSGGYVAVPVTLDGTLEQGRAWVEMTEAIPIPKALLTPRYPGPKVDPRPSRETTEGNRNNTLTSLAGSMRHCGMSEAAIRAGLLAENQERCKPPLPECEVERIASSVARYELGETPTDHQGLERRKPEWPAPLGQDAFQGIAGKFVAAVAPHTEADPVALLLSFLSAFGSVVGPGPRDMIGEDAHGARIWPVFVGDTAAGRKGTSFSVVRKLFCEVDETWVTRIASNVGSGEVVIHEVRDPRRELTDEGAMVVKDLGVEDKRLFIAESEFASVLRVAGRDGSVLSPILRTAWDGGTLRHTVKRQPAVATDAHIVVLGHITPEEIRKELSALERANGFANRFLFAMVRRSQSLPRAAGLPEGLLEEFVDRLRIFIDAAKQWKVVTPTETFWAVYEPHYDRLSSPPPGLVGSILARGAPYVRRLALLYALLDGESLIYARHARAALAIWEYCEASVHYLFDGRMGDGDSDKVLEALHSAQEGLTRTEVRDLFGRHKKGEEIAHLRDGLLWAGRIEVEVETTGGRDSERWRLAKDSKGSSVASVAVANAFYGEVK